MRDWMRYVDRRLALGDLARDRRERIVREVAEHLEETYREAKARGASDDEADATARRQVVGWPELSSEIRSAVGPHVRLRIDRWLDRLEPLARRWGSAGPDLLEDLRHGLRILGRGRAFTALAVLTLALGIGANVAIFSIIDGVLLKPLPYADPDRLVMLRIDAEGLEGYPGLSRAEVEAFRQETDLFEGLGTMVGFTVGLTAPGSMEQVPAVTVSPELFAVLGVRPVMGRGFDPREDRYTENGAFRSVLISYELWQRRYGGEPDILDRRIEIDNVDRQVIGVMPPGFRLLLGPGANVAAHNDVWVPQFDGETFFHVHAWKTVGRLKDGVTPRQAREELDAVGRRVTERYPQAYGSSPATFRVLPLKGDLVSGVRRGVWMLFVASALVLLVGCVNIANLQLARGVARRTELAVRASLGATRGRILRQVVTENVVLGVLGGAAGSLVALAVIRALRFLPVELPRGDGVALNGSAFAFTLAVSVFAGILFGLLPAWQASRLERQSLLRSAGRGVAGGRLRSGLLVSEVAVSVVLLVGAGLMVRSFAKLQRVDLGFEPRNLLTMNVSVDAERFPDIPHRWNLYRQLLDEMRSLPGVDSAAGIRRLPLKGDQFVTGWARGDESEDDFLARTAAYDWVLPGYFETMQIRLVDGRGFEDLDNEGEKAVVVVDEALARLAWPGEDAVGKELLVDMRFGRFDLRKTEVIGVVETVRSLDPRQDGEPQIYFPFKSLSPNVTRMTLVLRTSGDPMGTASLAVGTIDRLGSGRPVHAVQTMDAYVSETTADTRFHLVLLGALALAALVLSSVGAFGVVAHTVSQQTREIGIRMALGARPGDILSGVVLQGMKAAGIGVLVGLSGALGLARSVEHLLFDVAPQDPPTLVAVSLVLAAITLLACYLPARRATRVDPTMALRHD